MSTLGRSSQPTAIQSLAVSKLAADFGQLRTPTKNLGFATNVDELALAETEYRGPTDWEVVRLHQQPQYVQSGP